MKTLTKTNMKTQGVRGDAGGVILEKSKFPFEDKDLAFLCFKGTASNTLYKNDNETIKILLKNGDLSTISEIDNALINESLSAPIKKFYICLLNE